VLILSEKPNYNPDLVWINLFVPTVAFSQLSSNICCPRDCVSQHNGGTSGAPIMPRDAVSRTAHVGTVGTKGLTRFRKDSSICNINITINNNNINITIIYLSQTGKNYNAHVCFPRGSVHWENYISISFHIEWDTIVVAVFLSILNHMEFNLVQNRKGKLSPQSYPTQCKRKYSFLSVASFWHKKLGAQLNPPFESLGTIYCRDCSEGFQDHDVELRQFSRIKLFEWS